MQTLEISTPAVLFPAISLLMLAYTNKFLALASIIRQLASRTKTVDEFTVKQIKNLKFRIILLKFTQGSGLLSILGCLISIICLMNNSQFVGAFFFILSIGFMMLSVFLAFCETIFSGNALKYELRRMERDQQKKSD